VREVTGEGDRVKTRRSVRSKIIRSGQLGILLPPCRSKSGNHAGDKS
jgi:hypothetical protein